MLLAGPSDPAKAKLLAPASIRAMYGIDAVRNVLYASASAPQALTDIDLLFKDPFACEHTVGIVKPDAVRHWDQIAHALHTHGFTVLLRDDVYFSPQRAEEFYLQTGLTVQASGPHVTHLSMGRSIALLLYKPAAVSSLLNLFGENLDPLKCRAKYPQCLRARFGSDEVFNAFYCSASLPQARKDVTFFFPQIPRADIPQVEEVKTIIRSRPARAANAMSLHEVLVEGLTYLCQVKPTGLDAVTELANWSQIHTHTHALTAIASLNLVTNDATLRDE